MAFRRGEQPALRTVYRRHAPEIAKMLRCGFGFASHGGTAKRFTGFDNALELHDALHETFRRAFEPQARNAYDGIRPYGPYLKTIARNVVLQATRKYGRRFVDVDDDALPALVAPEDDDPERAAALAQTQQLVRAFVATLSDDDRRFLTVRFTEGHSQRDAATLLGLGRQQVRTREERLRARLLRYLRERDVPLPIAAWVPWLLVTALAEEVGR